MLDNIPREIKTFGRLELYYKKGMGQGKVGDQISDKTTNRTYIYV